MSSNQKGTLFMAMVLAAFGIFWMISSMLIPIISLTDAAGPRLVPFVSSACLTFVCLLLIVQTVLAGRRTDSGSIKEDEALGGARKDDEPKVPYWRPVGGFASLLLFILLLDHLHFFINTIIVSVLGLAFAGEPLKPRLLLYALIISGIAYGIFIFLLQIPLPGSRFR